jgi:Cu(I)/Ag(I) efflux system membrane protein CusA/SilA
MMTVMAIMAGLIPILWSQGTGADVMKRIAAPMVGGMITSTVLVLLVIPAVYSLWKERLMAHAAHAGSAPESDKTASDGLVELTR